MRLNVQRSDSAPLPEIKPLQYVQFIAPSSGGFTPINTDFSREASTFGAGLGESMRENSPEGKAKKAADAQRQILKDKELGIDVESKQASLADAKFQSGIDQKYGDEERGARLAGVKFNNQQDQDSINTKAAEKARHEKVMSTLTPTETPGVFSTPGGQKVRVNPENNQLSLYDEMSKIKPDTVNTDEGVMSLTYDAEGNPHTKRIGGLPPKEGKDGSGISKGQDAVDKLIGTDYAKYVAEGGYSDTQKALSQLRGVAESLKTNNVTGPGIGLVPDKLLNIANPKAIATRDAIQEVAQRNLRQVLGGQFSKEEGKALIDRAYNVSQPEEENLKRVNRLIGQIEQAAEAKRNAFDYFEKNKTMSGWEGKLPSMSDFDPEQDSPTGTPSNSGNQMPILNTGDEVERAKLSGSIKAGDKFKDASGKIWTVK